MSKSQRGQRRKVGVDGRVSPLTATNVLDHCRNWKIPVEIKE